MKNNAKPIVALLSGAVLLLSALGQTAQAQSTVAYLADNSGNGPGGNVSTSLKVTSTVTENLSTDIYTYSYSVFNPSGDTAPATSFSVAFNSGAPGAVLTTGGYSISGNGAINMFAGNDIGVIWTPDTLLPGNTEVLTFESDDAPILGTANANGFSPGPWATTFVSGNPVAATEVYVPTTVPEPTTTALLTGCLLLLPFRSTMLRKIWKQ